MANTISEETLMGMSAHLLGLIFKNSLEVSSQADVESTMQIHNGQKLYPKLIITAPHGGGAVKISLMLCDPETDEPIIGMYEATGDALSHLPKH